MQLHAGTSGFSYEGWRGSFYPADLPASEMLGFYGRHLSTVEINNSFYRMPKVSLLEGWMQQVPAAFRFVLKAPRRITHIKKLREVADDVAYLDKAAATLGDRRGPILFQLPPYLRKDVALLKDLLEMLPPGHRSALEFRHRSWLDDEVYELLRDAGEALCVADAGEECDAPLLATAAFGYLRLRRQDYDEAALTSWAERVRAQPWQEVFVFFKHEDARCALRPGARRSSARRRSPGGVARRALLDAGRAPSGAVAAVAAER